MSDEAIWIEYDKLTKVNEQLKTIIEELQQAASRSDDVEGAIGSPYGHTRLRQRVHDFEGRWNDRRSALVGEIEKVQQHVQGVIEGVEEWDTSTAAQMEIDVTGSTTAPRPV